MGIALEEERREGKGGKGRKGREGREGKGGKGRKGRKAFVSWHAQGTFRMPRRSLML